MDTLIPLLELALALWFVYNVGVYAWRRVRNRRASETFRSIAGAGRNLGEQERAALRSWLANPREPGGEPALLRDGQAFTLSGEFVRHGLRQQLGSTMHDTLAGVDVRLPYDAAQFLQPANSAEVVLTSGYAVVVTLNDRFDIAAGRARAVAANRQKIAAAHPDIALPEIDPTLAAADLAMLGFEPLGLRDESLAERASRSTTSLADDIFVGTTIALGSTALVLGSARPDDTSAAWIVIGAALLVAAIWRWTRSTALRGAQKVHRLRGRLSRTSLTNQRGPGSGEFQLGRRFTITAPFHWARFINPAPLDPVDIEIRALDGSMVRYRDSQSVDAEAARFPHRPSRSVAGASAAAAFAMFVALTVYDDIGFDFARTRAWAAGTHAPTAAPVARDAEVAGADADAAPDEHPAPRCGHRPCDSPRWAALRAALVALASALTLACVLRWLQQRVAAAARFRRLEAYCDERTKLFASAPPAV